jgi:hypothetical protein
MFLLYLIAEKQFWWSRILCLDKQSELTWPKIKTSAEKINETLENAAIKEISLDELFD